MRAGTMRDACDVLLQLIVDIDLLNRFLTGQQLVGRGHGLELVDGRRALKAIEHLDLVGDIQIAEVDAHQEAIDLGFRQREGAGEFDRVLGRQYQEGRGERVGGAVDRHLFLLHRFQQCRWGLGRCAVDLIGEQDLREDRTLAELELLRRRAVDVHASDIRREQVRRELQTLEAATQRAGERLRQHRLAHAGHVFDQDVAAAQQRNHAQFDLRRFTDEHTADVFHNPRTERLDRSVLHLHPLTSFSMIRFRGRRRSVTGQTVYRVYSLPRYLRLPRRTSPALSPPMVPPLSTSTSSMTRPSVSRPADPSGPTGPIAPASSATTMKPTATMTPFQVDPPIGPITPARNPPASSAPKVSSPWETSWPR